jgi:hypothetical protein
MAKFLFIYRGGDTDEAKYSPEQMQAYMQKWNDWIGEGFQKGFMLDPGDALHPGGKIVGADRVVTDGPFAESKELVGGYSVINAADFNAAAEIAKGCPILLAGGAVEVRQMAEIAPKM